jgi:ADP-ribosylglycohydrolase
MIGCSAGDIAGVPYEHSLFKSESLDFPLFQDRSHFSDDTILTAAMADSLITGDSYENTLLQYAQKYPKGGYGGMFVQWVGDKKRKPYNSFGNGSAMRSSPFGYAFKDWKKVLFESGKAAEITHNHPEGVKGAQAIALCVHAAYLKKGKKSVTAVARYFDYDISKPVEEIRKTHKFDATCQGTVPQAVSCFLESENFEHAIRLAISLGGDTDTLAAITGSIAEAHYGCVPLDMADIVYDKLDGHLRMIFTTFYDRFIPNMLIGKWRENKEKNLWKNE